MSGGKPFGEMMKRAGREKRIEGETISRREGAEKTEKKQNRWKF